MASLSSVGRPASLVAKLFLPPQADANILDLLPVPSFTSSGLLSGVTALLCPHWPTSERTRSESGHLRCMALRSTAYWLKQQSPTGGLRWPVRSERLATAGLKNFELTPPSSHPFSRGHLHLGHFPGFEAGRISLSKVPREILRKSCYSQE